MRDLQLWKAPKQLQILVCSLDSTKKCIDALPVDGIPTNADQKRISLPTVLKICLEWKNEFKQEPADYVAHGNCTRAWAGGMKALDTSMFSGTDL